MSKQTSLHGKNSTPPPKILPALQKMKDAYLYWFHHYAKIPKTHRYTLALKIDNLFVEILEMISTAGFTNPKEKLPYLRVAIRKLDVTKVLLLVLWESKSLEPKKYILLSEKLDEVGRMLGGWYGQVQKQNSPENSTGEK